MSTKESSSSKDTGYTTLPLKWTPVKDLLSKDLLKDPKIMNLIIRSLLGSNIPSDAYHVSQTEWSNGTRSDVVYAANHNKNEEFPPVIIEIQYMVNQEFIYRLINYASNAFDRYKVSPVILVIVTNSFCSAEFQNQFTINENNTCLLEASCKLWAKKCVFLTPELVSTHFNDEDLNPMAALGFFVTKHNVNEMPEKNRTDPTYVLLSSVVNCILLKDGAENIDKSSLSYHLQQIKRNFESILEDDEDPGENETKKCVKEGLLWVEKLENEFEIESLNSPIKKYTEEDAAFIEEQTKGKKTIPWKEIFNKV
ncbi:hypothetical protein G6F56_011539 [Rhizopus delemar]|nr:hypothetical protein G6F56_011539 [Rhizopus delemar]